MRRLLFVLLSIVCCNIYGCSSPAPPTVPDDWELVEAGDAFTFKAPPDLQPVEVQGIDSLVGKYATSTFELSFDYGWYSSPMDRRGYDRSSTRIDGLKAYVVRGDDVMGVHFPEVQGDTKLTMYARLSGADPATIETIFRTIDFR